MYDAGGGGGRSSSGVALFSYLLLAFCFCLVLCALCFLLFVVICLLLCLAFLEQSPFTRLCVLLLALSRSRLPRKPLSALSCLIVCVCAASLFRQCSTLAFTSWDLCIFSNWRGQHRFVFLLFSLCSGFFIFSLRFSFAIRINFLAALFALITSAWQSFARRWLSSLILIRMPDDNRSEFIQNS